jgi:hypothetical protein
MKNNLFQKKCGAINNRAPEQKYMPFPERGSNTPPDSAPASAVMELERNYRRDDDKPSAQAVEVQR